MLNLQLGIRWSISRNARDPVLRQLPSSVFSEKASAIFLLQVTLIPPVALALLSHNFGFPKKQANQFRLVLLAWTPG